MKKNKQHSRFPYQHRLALTIIIFTLFPCVILGGIYLKLVRPQWIHSTLDEHYNTVDSTALLVSDQLTEMHSKMQYVLFDSTLRPYISRFSKLTLTYELELVEKLEETAASLTADNPGLVIRWYPYYSQKSYGSNCYTLDILDQEFAQEGNSDGYAKILSLEDGETLWIARRICRNINNKGEVENRLCLYTQLGAVSSTNCVMELSIPLTQIYESQKHNSVPDSLFFFCLQQEQEYLNISFDTELPASQLETMMAQYQTRGQVPGYHLISSTVPNIKYGQVLLFLPDSYVQRSLYPHIISFVGIAALVAMIIVLSSYLTSHLLAQRIIRVIDAINSNLDSYFTHSDQQVYHSDDIAGISVRIEQLIQNTQEYCQKLEYYEKENMRMELELLQQRFNPHLLYNTMGALKSHVKNPVLQSTIDSLCQYYRIILSNGHLIIQIKDEIEMIKEYLYIQKITYGLKDIEYQFDIDEQVKKASIIKHILQPIVENAIHHGLRPAKRKGFLCIKALRENNCIVIQVTDDGIGMSPETSTQLLVEPLPTISGGYGIYNVQQRIQLYYGSEYGLKIESCVGKGTTVSVSIPDTTSAHNIDLQPQIHKENSQRK